MLYIHPIDVALFSYCPVLKQRNKQDKIDPNLKITELGIKYALMDGELNVCLKDSIIDSRKLLRSWEKIWWPIAAENNISMKEADDLMLKCISRLSDYCKYDISCWPTVGVNIESEIPINNSILKARADIVKINPTSKKTNKVLITIGTRNLSEISAALDPFIRATAYGFSDTETEIIEHIYINIGSPRGKLKIITSYFNKREMATIKKMLYHIEYGIRTNAYYANSFMCDKCKECQNLKL